MKIFNDILSGLKYSGYVIFHPFKGFWDLKHEKRGNLGSAMTIVFFLFVTFFLKYVATGFLFNTNDITKVNVLTIFASVLIPFFLWCFSNWCITTLVDGEGSLYDIIITSAYALTPMVLIQIPTVIFSNFITLDEQSFYIAFFMLSIIWTVFLLFVGIMTVHQFGIGKTLGTIAIALAGMIVILFLAILLLLLVQQVINFFLMIKLELELRYAI